MVGNRRRKNVLHTKLWRDMGRSAMQYVAIVLLCALGTWVFSGLEGTWRMIQLSSETYFEQNVLADFWVSVTEASKADVDNLDNVRGVDSTQARFSAEMDTPDLGEDVSLMVHAYQGEPRINVPLIRQGATLNHADIRGCLLDERFASAHSLNVGDSVKLRFQNQDITFVIRGLALSPEHVISAKDVMPDPLQYGFAIVSWDAFSQYAPNEVLLTLKSGADSVQAENDIQAMLPRALVLTQKTDASTQRTRTEVTMFRNLTYIFPVLAFGVACMIVLTTLTRMIENQRMQMGTLKALGYNRRKIRAHYLSYALVPSLIGAMLGLMVGRYTLPDMLYNMEAQHYTLPERLRPPISLTEWGMTALMVLLSVGICLYAYRKAAKEEAAALLRPKPPRAGSRVLLEGWTAVWRRFSFNTKMVVRNIARNKGRAAVSIVGLLCCNMLIICAMGLQDSVSACIGDYYRGTVGYDVRVDLDQNAGTLESYQSRYTAARMEGLMEKSVSLRYGNASRAVVLDVLKDGQQLMRLGKNNTVVALPKDAIAISLKLSEITGLKAGDQVELWLPGDDEALPFTISTVFETNIGQTVYMDADVWENLHKGAFTPTALLLEAPTPLTLHQLAEADEVTVFKYPEDQYRQTMTIMDSTTAVFNLMYGAALGLAFVICYNMGLITFTERMRDYATLKVLGYHQKEIRKLMMWENNLITVIGAAMGVLPGIALTQAVLSSVHSENNVFIAHVTFQTLAMASVLTCLFSVLIQWLITRKVRSINMVEALKSVE